MVLILPDGSLSVLKIRRNGEVTSSFDERFIIEESETGDFEFSYLFIREGEQRHENLARTYNTFASRAGAGISAKGISPPDVRSFTRSNRELQSIY
jgi:hypothetical protein